MAKRKVNIAIIAYQGAKSKAVDLYGFREEEIDVHEDDLERFDALNGVTPMTEAEHLNASGPAGPDPLDHGTDQGSPAVEVDEPAFVSNSGDLPEPTRSARLAEWQDYAEQEGVDLEHEDGTAKTKKELIAELTGD